jgi:hypothetical protein
MRKPMTSIQLTQHYFDLSNAGRLDDIRRLFSKSSTYSSANTGLYLGVDDIMQMQQAFFARFSTLRWTMHTIEEIKPGIVLVDFTLNGVAHDGDVIAVDGLESVVVYNQLIQHIEIRNKH